MLLCALRILGQPCPPPVPLSPPWLSIPAQPYEHHWSSEGTTAAAHVYVMPTTSGQLGRPFVFVEGIDFGLGTENTALRNGNFGWSEFNGCNTAAYPMMAEMPVLLDSLMHRGFTPVLIDFDDGTADLMINAELLADILLHLRDHKTDPRPMVLSGASMGGQLSRIALKKLEQSGEPHCTQLYISLDSPHQGSNVPLGLQQMIHFLANDSEGQDDLSELVQALHSPAARQLLLRQVSGLTPRINYQDNLDALGLPQYCRNVAIANGSTTAMPGQSAPLLDYEHAILESGVLGDIAPLFRLEIQPHPGVTNHPSSLSGNPLTAHAQAPPESGFPWPLDCEVGHGIASDISIWGSGLDHLPGGTRPSLGQFVEAFNGAAQDADLPWPFCISPISPEEHQPLHSFIPTASALGIPPPWPAPPLPATFLLNSPFDAVHIGVANEPHSQVNPSNIFFLLQQLDAVASPLLPGQLLADTNVTAESIWKLPGISIHGRVGLQSCDSEFAPSNAPDNSHGEFRMQGCSGPLVIQEDGALELGWAPEWSQQASTAHLILEPHAVMDIYGQLVVSAGSQIELMPGAKLNLFSGQLHLLSNAQILVHDGAAITLNGHTLWTQAPYSMSRLNGAIQVESQAQWLIHLASGAQIETTTSLTIHGEPDASVQLQALESETHWTLNEQASLHVTGLSSWEAEGCGFRFMGNTQFHMALPGLNRWSSQWIGNPSDSLWIEGDLWLDHHHCQGLTLNQDNGRLDAHHSTFRWGSNHHNHCQINLANAHFLSHPFYHTAPIASGPNVIQDSRFEDGPVGLESRGGTLRVESTDFERLDVAIHSKSQRLEVMCNQFRDSDIGILANRSVLMMNPESGGGWNVFLDNDVHLRFLQALALHCTGGFNHFGNWGSDWAQGTINLTCNGMPIDLIISGQSWSWPTGWPQVQSGLSTPIENGQSCAIHAVDMSPVSPALCRNEDASKRE